MNVGRVYTGEWTAKKRDRQRLARRTGKKVDGRRYVEKTTSHRVLDEVILDNISSRAWITSKDLYHLVVADYGTLCERVFYEHIRKLRVREGEALLVHLGPNRQLSYRKAVSPSK